MKVLVTIKEGTTRDSFLGKSARELLASEFDVFYNDTGKEYTEEEIGHVLDRGFDIVLTGWGTPSLVGNEKKFRLLAHTGGSVGDLIVPSSFDAGIKAISANSIYAVSTAEGALSYILSALRCVPRETEKMKTAGYWKDGTEPFTRSLIGKTVGIVGVGAVARALISFLLPFGVNLKLFDTYGIDPDYLRKTGAVQTSIEDVFSTCDVISVHAALTEKTVRMIGEREFSLIRDGALFVNTSRGAIIDENALAASLRSGRFYAFLDVYEQEPLPAESELRRLDNVYLMPHKAGPASDLYPIIGERIVEDMIRFRDGLPLEYEIKREEASRMTRHSSTMK